MEQIFRIADFVFKSFLHIWPYLLVTVPLAVIINLTGASKYITKAFGTNPVLSVFLATLVGALSPFCSCGVIPVITSLLIGGVPLAPIMSFWIASPSMDPEIFFLSSSMLGWELAIWRLGSIFLISLLAGYLTLYALKKGFLTNEVLRINSQKERTNSVNSGWQYPVEIKGNTCSCSDETENKWKIRLVYREIIKATLMVAKFMGLAFLITAIITFYVPADLIKGIISMGPAKQVIIATLTGVPVYTSNLTALPLVGGLLDLGLNKGAALSFLIGGATTTLPAMIAVWGITRPRVFVMYISFVLIGALLAGLCFNLFS